MATTVWTGDDIDKLILLVGKYECIWKVDHPNYGKRGLKDAAYRRITVEFPN